jgi:hypothetical protein
MSSNVCGILSQFCRQRERPTLNGTHWLSVCADGVNMLGRSNAACERVEHFLYLGTTAKNENSISEENKDRLTLGNACYHSVKDFCLPVCYPKI